MFVVLTVQPRKSREICKVYEKEGCLFLKSENGVIRITPQTPEIIRISYSENGQFCSEQSNHLDDFAGKCKWTYKELESDVCIETDVLNVRVNRYTGSVRYEKPDGTLIFSERDTESKIVEEFDSYKMVVNENTELEKIQTPDGVKYKVKEADKVFDKKLYHTRLYMEFTPDEKLFGLGQAEEGVWNLRNTTQYLNQANLKIAIPFVLSSKGYGIMLSTQSPAIFSDEQYGTYFYTEADEYLDYYFIAGNNFDDVISGYRFLSGQAVMLPEWAFGYMQSQERYESAKEIIEVVDKFREHEFGLDTIVLDWMSWKDGHWGQKSFDEERFPNPSAMVDTLHEKDAHFMISIWPNMNPVTDNYQESLKNDTLLPASELYDAFSEKGRNLYWEQVNRGLFKHGIDAWWCDSSEPITPEWMKLHKPEPSVMYREYVDSTANCMPMQQSNAYSLYHAKSIYDGQRGVTDDKRVVNLTRTGYVGIQKYGTVLWSGDIYASWDTLKKQIVAGLQFCASGLPYWTLDIGAFFVKKGEYWYWNGEYDLANEDPKYRELYVRWFQYGAFLPIFRSHGTDCRREPWYFGEPGDAYYDALLKANRLRYSLMPYIYSVAARVWKDNGTMMRMLAFDFADDEKALDVADQYMFGPSLLVCPITEPMKDKSGKCTRKVYLPKGTVWYDVRTGQKYNGGCEIEAEAGIDSIPVYARAGAVIPVKEPANSTAGMRGQDITLKIYAGADGKFELYEDAGDGYGYENGDYCLTTITYSDENRSVKWTSEGNEDYRVGSINIDIIE